jgi:hypothetical protein
MVLTTFQNLNTPFFKLLHHQFFKRHKTYPALSVSGIWTCILPTNLHAAPCTPDSALYPPSNLHLHPALYRHPGQTSRLPEALASSSGGFNDSADFTVCR